MYSCGITTYNRPDYLENALASVFSQTYLPTEIIVVDDSTENDLSRLNREICSKYSIIRYIKNEERLGIARNRNTILEYASENIIALLDDDDMWIEKQKCERQLEYLSTHPCKLVCCPASFSKQVIELAPKTFPEDLLSTLMVRNGLIHTSSVMFYRSFAMQVGGYDERLPRGVDSDLFRRMLILDRYSIKLTNDTYIYYNTNSGNNVTHIKGFYEAFKILKLNAYLFKKYRKIFLRNPNLIASRILNTLRTVKKALL